MPKTLLLADDSVVIQKLVGLSFANEDVELTTTDNGDDAIARARELKPDLVLADVVMPGKNGYEVCEALKADPALRHIPVLLLTGTFEAFDENRARSAGSDGHITKPFEAQALVDRVTELLAQAPPAPELAATTPNLDDDGPGVTRLAAVPPPPPPTMDTSDSFEFFDDGEDVLADAAPPAPAAPQPPAAPPPLAQPPSPAPAQAAAAQPAARPLPPLGGAGDADDALMPDVAPSTTPPIDDLAFDADEAMAGGDPGATTVHLTEEAESASADDDLLLGDAPSWGDDLEIGPEPIRSPADDATRVSDDLFQDPPAPAASPAPRDLDRALAEDAARPPASVAGGGGARPSDALAFGDSPSAARPDPMQTMLADDLFGDSTPPPLPSGSAVPEELDLDAAGPATKPAQGLADDFEVSSSDLEHSIPDMPPPDLRPESASATAAPKPAAPAAPPAAPSSPPAAPSTPPAAAPAPPEPVRVAEPADDFSVSDGLLAGGPPVAEAPAPAAEARPAPTVAPSPPASAPGPDLTPIMRERVHETLERVAWEAFADLSDTIVKQVVEKVEQVAWEVIPQMAEAAIKEEIRRMKGETDE